MSIKFHFTRDIPGDFPAPLHARSSHNVNYGEAAQIERTRMRHVLSRRARRILVLSVQRRGARTAGLDRRMPARRSVSVVPQNAGLTRPELFPEEPAQPGRHARLGVALFEGIRKNAHRLGWTFKFRR